MKKKVIVFECNNYDFDIIYGLLKKGIKLLKLPSIPEKILIKPNMLSAKTPEEGVTTHPLILSALIEIFKNKKIIIGDSPASISKPIEVYWEKCGYKTLKEKYNVELKKFDNSIPLEIKINNKKIVVPLSSFVQDYSILNVPKFKTHSLTTLTLGIKNLYGLIPGIKKSLLHSKFISPYEFSSLLVEFYKKIEDKIFLTVVDGITGMEGDGPSSGKIKNIGYIILGEKPIHVDYVCCKLVGIKPEKVDFIKIYIEKYGFSEPEVIGKFKVLEDFKLPSTKKYFFINNRILSMLLFPVIKFFKIVPVILKRKCKKCLECYKICPVKAISKDLKFNRKKCILCLCCFEACPYKAIEIKKSFVASIFI